jgi:hypothetical protein
MFWLKETGRFSVATFLPLPFHSMLPRMRMPIEDLERHSK